MAVGKCTIWEKLGPIVKCIDTQQDTRRSAKKGETIPVQETIDRSSFEEGKEHLRAAYRDSMCFLPTLFS